MRERGGLLFYYYFISCSVITAVWQFKPIIVEETILNTLTGLINEESMSNNLIDYIQSLMEHYPPGGRVLHIILPQGMSS